MTRLSSATSLLLFALVIGLDLGLTLTPGKPSSNPVVAGWLPVDAPNQLNDVHPEASAHVDQESRPDESNSETHTAPLTVRAPEIFNKLADGVRSGLRVEGILGSDGSNSNFKHDRLHRDPPAAPPSANWRKTQGREGNLPSLPSRRTPANSLDASLQGDEVMPEHRLPAPRESQLSPGAITPNKPRRHVRSAGPDKGQANANPLMEYRPTYSDKTSAMEDEASSDGNMGYMGYSQQLCSGIQWSCQDKCGIDFGDLPCRCDRHCLLYNDCCQDFSLACPAYHHRALQAVADLDEVRPDCDRPSRPLLLKSCLKGNNSAVAERCQGTPDRDSLYDVTPVFSEDAMMMFRNVHCAECSGLNASQVLPWKGVLYCRNATLTAADIFSPHLSGQCTFRWAPPSDMRLCYPKPSELPPVPSTSTILPLMTSYGIEGNVTTEKSDGAPVMAEMDMQDQVDLIKCSMAEHIMDDMKQKNYSHCYSSSNLPCNPNSSVSTNVIYSFELNLQEGKATMRLVHGQHDEEAEDEGSNLALPTLFHCDVDGGRCVVERCGGRGAFPWGNVCQESPISVFVQIALWYEEKKDLRKEGLLMITPKMESTAQTLADRVVENLGDNEFTSSCRTEGNHLRTQTYPDKHWLWSATLICEVIADAETTLTRASYVSMAQNTLLNSIIAVQQEVKMPMDMNVTLCLLGVPRANNVISDCFLLNRPLNGTRLVAVLKSNITVEGYISLACCIASDIGLLARIVLQYFVPFFNTYPGKVQFCLCCSLLFAYTSFLAGGIVEEGSEACRAVAVTTHWGFLCALFWMNVTAYQIWHTFRHWSHQVLSKGKSSLLIFCLYTIFIPLAIVGSALLVEALNPENDFSPRYGYSVCWITKPYAVITYFMVPCAVICLANTFLVGMTLRGLRKQRKNVREFQRSGQIAAVSDVTITVKIILLVGVTWFIGIIAAIFETQVLWMMFSVVNASLGLVIAIVLLCNRRMFNLLKTKLRCVQPDSTSTVSTGIPNNI